jgi:hypothetical protein
MSTPERAFVERLEDEFARLAQRDARRAGRRRRPLVAVAAAFALCVSGGAAIAVTGVLDPADPTAGFGEGQRERAVAMAGTDSTGRPWQLVSARAGDAFCLSLRSGSVPDPSPTSSGQCGGLTPGTLEATVGGAEGGVAHVYGTLPDEAAAVVVTAGAQAHTAVVADDEHGVPGRFFVGEIPPGDDLDLTVTVRDGTGATIASEPLRDLVRRSSPY